MPTRFSPVVCLRRNLAVRHGIGEGRQTTRDAVIHLVTSSSIAAAENLQSPDWTRCIRSCSGVNREEFVVVGWSDPEGSRHRIGSLLLYAGRAGTGMPEAELERLWQRFQPLALEKMPIAIPPPRGSRFGSPLVLSRVHWVRPEMVVEVSYVEWTP
ncbi:MAG: hypothetical protein WCB44_02875, partial [Stellaceae bacterium]